jgi:hypothetical protein
MILLQDLHKNFLAGIKRLIAGKIIMQSIWEKLIWPIPFLPRLKE